MSFELLRCDRFGDFAIIHAIQKLVDEDEEEPTEYVEALIRATFWITLSGESARIVAAHLSSLPSDSAADCPSAVSTG